MTEKREDKNDNNLLRLVNTFACAGCGAGIDTTDEKSLCEECEDKLMNMASWCVECDQPIKT